MKKLFALLVLIFLIILVIECNYYKSYGVDYSNIPIQSVENISDFISYNEGEVIIMYEKSNPLDFVKVKTNAFLNSYSIEDTVDFENVKLKNDKTKVYTRAKTNENGITLSISLINPGVNESL